MAEFVVLERQNPMLGLSHGVFRSEEQTGMPICLCYNETQAAMVAAALTAYAPDRSAAPVRESAARMPATRARTRPTTKARKPATRQGRKR